MTKKPLATFLENSASNVSYLSPKRQNELISLIGDEILSVISSEIRAAPCFAATADDTTLCPVNHSFALLLDI